MSEQRTIFFVAEAYKTGVLSVEQYLDQSRRSLRRVREMVLLQEERTERALRLLEDLKDAP